MFGLRTMEPQDGSTVGDLPQPAADVVTSSPEANVPTVDVVDPVHEKDYQEAHQQPSPSSDFQPPKEVCFVHPLKLTPIVVKDKEAQLRAKALFNSVAAEEDVDWKKKVDESVEDDFQFTMSQRPAQFSPPSKPTSFSSSLKRPIDSLKIVKDAFRTPESNTRKKRAPAGLFRPPRPLDNTLPMGIKSNYIDPSSLARLVGAASSSILPQLNPSLLETPDSKVQSFLSSSPFPGVPGLVSSTSAQQVPHSSLNTTSSDRSSGFGSAASCSSRIISSPMTEGLTESEMDDIAALSMDCFSDENSFSEQPPPPSPEKKAVLQDLSECSALKNITSSNVKHLSASDMQDIEEISHLSFAGLFDDF
ncbi:hypothetical protein RvY_08755 [Ramazzottius varieornatus]|uniref:Uncharacterized protein n=1 Tax=Ramazzottius varieornatus TaxID=947166 RepID=A0A1D1V702_RAMVA|nr:hypothetical protein RvY_08755 [Ramazzottius varieornatus]